MAKSRRAAADARNDATTQSVAEAEWGRIRGSRHLIRVNEPSGGAAVVMLLGNPVDVVQPKVLTALGGVTTFEMRAGAIGVVDVARSVRARVRAAGPSGASEVTAAGVTTAAAV